MKEHMAKQTKVQGEHINCHTPEGLAEARKFIVATVPMVIFVDEDGKESKRCSTKEEVENFLKEI